ncbi:MAG: heparinase [Planctomycetes bacterium]|nr:heparinase [Planctomycetota bacterium]
MASAQTLLRYWHTLRHLKPAQFVGRVRFRLSRPRVDVRPAPTLRERDGAWCEAARRRASLEAPGTFRFLNVSHALSDVGWDGDQVAKLWRYNQHYFEDLHGVGAEARTAWHHDLLARWIRDNPHARGTGWEPYPSSLRIVNWIKWAWQGQALSSEAVHSLAVQARWLMQRLEWHLLGNHLFVNAKALVFAGLFFEGPEADAWFEKGLHILRREVPEQILKDGGQFERSPMYHALALEDMLDLWNASRACAKALRPADAEWFRSQHDRIESMRRWLSAMTHPDGEIALFNDAAIGIAPSPAALADYAARLGFAPLAPEADGFTHLEASGFIRVQQGPMVAILDVGPIGPDYLPGHAHADTLSFELSLHGRRVLVNSGTSVYGIGAERLRQRGTAAHNTLTVDGADSSEVWGGFRVARRARPLDLRILSSATSLKIACSHDGFLRLGGGAIHRRTWTFTPGALEVFDEVPGRGTLACHWHFAPDLEISAINPSSIALGDHRTMTVEVQRAAWFVERSTWHPEFGRSVPNWVAITRLPGRTGVVRFTWS